MSIKRNRRPTANMGRLISSEQLTKILALSRQRQGPTFLREMLTITACTGMTARELLGLSRSGNALRRFRVNRDR
jgi:hypothetical protein